MNAIEFRGLVGVVLGFALLGGKGGWACKSAGAIDATAPTVTSTSTSPLWRPGERRLANIRQLTFGGENAEAYFGPKGDALIFQSTRGDLGCDQIFRMDIDGRRVQQLSSGKGRTTCGYIQNDDSIVYASTEAHPGGCLLPPDRSQGYTWPLYPEFDLWRANADGSNARILFQSEGYDAEATICRKDGRIIFTSTMDGDPELYILDPTAADPKPIRITHTPGYDGGAFFSPDCSRIVWRASRPEGEALEEFQALLKRNLVRPSKLEIFVSDADGKNARQVTHNHAANFAPYMHPDNSQILFVSNQKDPAGRNFELFLIHADGTREEQVTFDASFDGFPMWSPDGKTLVFASNRNNTRQGETNIFVADWVHFEN